MFSMSKILNLWKPKIVIFAITFYYATKEHENEESQ